MITKEVVNKVGLEAEVLLYDKNNNLVIPDDYYMAHDDFIILGEIRSLPKTTVEDCVYDFYKDFFTYDFRAKCKKLHLNINKGWDILSPEFYSEILRKMGSKEIEKCKNIYKTDILNLSDDIIEDGKIISHKVSMGLHIHFSSHIVAKHSHEENTWINVKDNLWARNELIKHEEEVELYSLLTPNAMKSIVKALDKDILSKYNINETELKFRQPGFYEYKPWGFEYRSLPFTQTVYDNLPEIVTYCFNKLNNLSKVLR